MSKNQEKSDESKPYIGMGLDAISWSCEDVRGDKKTNVISTSPDPDIYYGMGLDAISWSCEEVRGKDVRGQT